MGGFIRKTLSFLGLADDENYYEDNNLDDREVARGNPPVENESKPETKYYKNDIREENVSRFRPKRRGSLLHSVKGEKKTRVFVIEPHEFEEVQIIGDNFKQEVPIIVNLQNTDSGLCKRIIDFCSGLTYALEGSIKKVADRVFLITPHNVEVTSEEKELLKEKGLYNQL